MSESELRAELGIRSRARQWVKGDAETDARLKKEFTQVMEQLKKIKGNV